MKNRFKNRTYLYFARRFCRRTAAAFDGKNWAYSYDGLNQLTGAALTEGATPLSSHAYSYDEIGNRLTSTLNGVTTSYTANDLNQYTAVGNVTPTYDDDGNMLTDGTMTYQYDVMNQLISAETAAEKYTFKYDFEGRRYETRKWTRSGGDWTLVQTTKYVYDNWNVIAEYVNGVKMKTYVWGEDLSGTMQGAGGVGGLLAEINASGTYLPVYDGNGNILSYKDLSGNTAATYAYDPFGSVLSHTGTDFAYKFSTKPEICGLYYYGFRYYHPALGRWLSRDPIREQGGMNLYGMVINDIVNKIDSLGHAECVCGVDITQMIDNLFENMDIVLGEHVGIVLRMARTVSIYNLVDGWDIEELRDAGSKGNTTFNTKECGQGEKCQNTVTLWGGCYKTWAVNYLLWGKLHKIISRTLSLAVSAVYAYRLISPFFSDEEEDWLLGTESRVFFTKVGYKEEKASPVNSNNYVECRLCNEKASDKIKALHARLKVGNGKYVFNSASATHIFEKK